MKNIVLPNILKPTYFTPKNSKNYIDSLKFLLKKEFGFDNLEHCHNIERPKKVKGWNTDQKSLLHKTVYKDFDRKKKSIIIPEYYKVCKEIVKLYKKKTGIKEWAVQRFPSMRFHWPKDLAVCEFHKDSDYSHSPAETNNIFFFTKARKTNSIWFERNLGCKDFFPLDMKKGKIAILNSAIYTHGNKINTEGWTRVSSDFRIIPVKAVEKGSKTLLKKRKLDLNDYFVDSRKI
tara:strand:- start:139 stop:837 length:699 start_codon:yes stop_codon:yes gene_type:complete